MKYTRCPKSLGGYTTVVITGERSLSGHPSSLQVQQGTPGMHLFSHQLCWCVLSNEVPSLIRHKGLWVEIEHLGSPTSA